MVKMNNTGIEYEVFVQKLVQAIIDSETAVGQKNIIVRHNETIPDKNGIQRQFDVLWDYELGGVTYRTIIECKDYNSSISIDKVDALIGKLTDFPGVRGIIATTKGYQRGAKEKAQQHNVELLCVREQNDNDWVDADGTPLIREVAVNIVILNAPRIIRCDTFLDKNYVEANNIDISLINFSKSLNVDVIIEDIEKNERYSLFELQHKIANKDDNYGKHEKDIFFENAFISDNTIRVKLKKIHVLYEVLASTNETITIDFSKELLGVVEYLSQGKKKVILKNGNIRTDNITQLPK